MPPPLAKSQLRPGALLAGKYRLLQMLGRGASGVVWSALNTTTSRKVALKLLLKPDPKQRERLLREARAAGALHHPNVVDVYDVTSLDDGSPVLVLELLEGQSLQQVVDERGPLPQREAAEICRDVARALAIAHASGIVHRDLKPANIFLHRPGDEPAVVKVVDFGISKNILAPEGTLTDTGMAVGSPAFMSPEQVRGERDLDGRTDLWSLGVILYEMLAGKRLFDGRTHEGLTQVLVEPIKPIDKAAPGVDPALSQVVHALLERDSAKRLSSAEVVADRLSAIVDSQAPSTMPPGPATVRPQASPSSGAQGAPTIPPASAGSQAHDTTVTPHKMKEQTPKAVVPKAYQDDDEDDEATHVAPMALRSALAQKTVPKVYADDDEDEEVDRTRVAADNELTAAIVATRAPTSQRVPPGADANQIPTLRPPSAPDPRELGAENDEAPATPRASGEQVAELLAEGGPRSDAPITRRAPEASTDGEAEKVGRSSHAPASGKAEKMVRSSQAPTSGRAAAPERTSQAPESKRSPPAAEDRKSLPIEERPTVPSDQEALQKAARAADEKLAATSTPEERTPMWVWAIVVIVLVLVAVLLLRNPG